MGSFGFPYVGGIIMDWKDERIKNGIAKALEEKGKRKFEQSLEMIVNFRAIDFSKPENRLNINLALPKGKGKPNKVVVIGSELTVHEAKKAGAEATVSADQIESFSKKEVKKLAKDHLFLVEPKFIGMVAKNWAKILGPRGKNPIPIPGDVKKMIDGTRNNVQVQTKGKYLPTVQAPIGTEKMEIEDAMANARTIFDAVTKKIPTGNVRSVYFKLSMGKPQKVV
jgi:large subunit ribosomal protein L1